MNELKSLLDALSGVTPRVPTRNGKKLSVSSDQNNPTWRPFENGHCTAVLYSFENGTIELNVFHKHDPEQVWRATVQKEQFSFAELLGRLPTATFDAATAVLALQSNDRIPLTALEDLRDIAGVLHTASQCRIDSVTERIAEIFTDLVVASRRRPPPSPEAEGTK